MSADPHRGRLTFWWASPVFRCTRCAGEWDRYDDVRATPCEVTL